MNKLKIEYKGGFRQVSKVLTHKHGANFAIIVDALIYIYNENLDNLIKIEDQYAVKISNGFLSRQTGLSMDITKRQVNKIEGLGLIIAIKKGQGNTRHYVINADGIDKYIEGSKVEFDEWFEKSKHSSKKDKARSKEADRIKIGLEALNKTMELLNLDGAISTKEPVQNPPTQLCDTDQPKRVKPAVADIEEETDKEKDKETTTEQNSIADPVFSDKDEAGSFIFTEEFNKKVYKHEYESFVKQYSDKELEDMSCEYENTHYCDNLIMPDDDDSLDTEIVPMKETDFYMIIYNTYQHLKNREETRAKSERETTKISASKEVSDSNWKEYEKVYKDLPNLHNQGLFHVSKKDRENFNSLSEYRQEWVISRVVAMKDSDKTTSRPAVYIEKAMNDKLEEYYDPNYRLSIAL